MKIAIIGCGKIADAHVDEIGKIPSVQLVAVCDLEPIMAEQLATRFAVPHWYSNVEQMLENTKPDVVHITTPPQSHVPLTRQAMAAGCHVFLEKPVALRHSDTETIVETARNTGKKLAVNYWPNFEVPALELRRLYNEGILGDAVHLESFYGYDLAGEYGMAVKRDPEHWVHRLPGKLFQNVLDHVLNKIVPYLGEDAPLIHAIAYKQDAEAGAGQLLDELRVIVRGNNTSAYATFSSHARPVGHSLRFYGTKNTVHVDFMARSLMLERKATFPSALGRLFPPFLLAKDHLQQGFKNVGQFYDARFHYFDGMRRLLTAFYQCIEQDSAVPIPYDEILRVSSMMDEIFRQVYPEVRA